MAPKLQDCHHGHSCGVVVFVILSEDVVFSAWRRFAVDSKQQNKSESFPYSLMLSIFILFLSVKNSWLFMISRIAEDGKCNHGYADSGGVSLEL